jgi:hypothetical protein
VGGVIRVHRAARGRRDRATGIPARALLAAFAALVLALVAPAATLAAGAKGQSSPENYREEIRPLKPPVQGVDLRSEGGDQFLLLTNRSDQAVTVIGYDGDPYLRFLPSREVDVNLRSPSKYLNEDRFGTLNVPQSARPGVAPKWQRVSGNGSYKWFDHRIHWMERTRPPQVKDPNKKTKVFDWEVPLKVGGRTVSAAGTLNWIPDSSSSGISAAAIAGIAAGALLLLALGGWLATRRRRPAGGGPREKREKAPKEAW